MGCFCWHHRNYVPNLYPVLLKRFSVFWCSNFWWFSFLMVAAVHSGLFCHFCLNILEPFLVILGPFLTIFGDFFHTKLWEKKKLIWPLCCAWKTCVENLLLLRKLHYSQQKFWNLTQPSIVLEMCTSRRHWPEN